MYYIIFNAALWAILVITELQYNWDRRDLGRSSPTSWLNHDQLWGQTRMLRNLSSHLFHEWRCPNLSAQPAPPDSAHGRKGLPHILWTTRLNLCLLPLSLTPVTVAPCTYWHPCGSWGLLSCPSRAISSPNWASLSLAASLHGTKGPATIILAAPAELIPLYCCFPHWRPKTGHCYSCDLRNAGSSSAKTVLNDASLLQHLLPRCTTGFFVAHA